MSAESSSPRLPARRPRDADGSSAALPARCPRCQRLTLRDAPASDVPMLQCERCAGTWIPREAAPALARSFPSVDAIDRERLQELRAAAARQNLETRVRYLRCPRCSILMARRQFALGSGIVVDRCRTHGVWFDGGELALARSYFEAGGPVDAAKRRAIARRRGSTPPPASPARALGPPVPVATLAELLLWLL